MNTSKRQVLLLLTVALATTITAHAQQTFPTAVEHEADTHQHKSRIFAGGAFTVWSDNKDKSFLFDFCPEIGYLFNDSWGLGVLAAYEHELENHNGQRHISNTFKFSPFARYYYYHKGPFNLYVDGGVGVNFGNYRLDNISSDKWGFEVGIRPGACVDLTEGLCLCLRMGFAGYRRDYFTAEEPRVGNNGFGLRFAPEELMIGIEFEF